MGRTRHAASSYLDTYRMGLSTHIALLLVVFAAANARTVYRPDNHGSGPTKHPVDKFRYAECGDKNIHPEFVIYLRQKITYDCENSAPLEFIADFLGGSVKIAELDLPEASGEIGGEKRRRHLGLSVREFGIDGYLQQCRNVGEHFNPFQTRHGDIRDSPKDRHVGDLGNVIINFEGTTVRFSDYLTSIGANNCDPILDITGRSITLSSREDDLGTSGTAFSKKDGNSGRVILCCAVRRVDGSGFPDFDKH